MAQHNFFFLLEKQTCAVRANETSARIFEAEAVLIVDPAGLLVKHYEFKEGR